MNKLKIALGLTAAFGLMACGSDSNSTAPDPSPAISSDSQSGVSSDSQDALSSAGTTVNSSNSNADVASSNSTEAPVACGFKMTDTEWEYSLKSTGSDGTSGTVKISYKVEGLKVTREETATVSGSTTSMVCRMMGSDHQITDVHDDGTLVKDQYCEDGYMVRVTTEKSEAASEADLQKTFDAVMQSCKVVNGLAEDAPSATGFKKACEFKAEDAVWSYTYGEESAYSKRTYVFEEDGSITSYRDEITPMSYIACKKTLPLEENTRLCSEEGLVNRSSSGLSNKDKEAFFKQVLSECQTENGIDPNATPDQSETPVEGGDNGEGNGDVAEGNACDIKTNFGGIPNEECFVMAANGDAAAFKSKCDSNRGNIVASCPSGETLKCELTSGNTINFYDQDSKVLGCEFMAHEMD